MGATTRGERVPGLIDPACVGDTFTEGIGPIELVGTSCVRITHFACRNLGDGDIERVVVGRTVMTLAALETALRQIEAFRAGLPYLFAEKPEGAAN
ncbi:MAG TPA: hypothetical protein VNZ94_01870 [Xanthobacteraceae bacterium]|nr:hypothetical protein [Xanthobacteraceae bacterium]